MPSDRQEITQIQSLEPRRLFSSLPPVIAPTDLAVTVLTPTTVKLTWNDNSPNDTGFYIFRSDDDGATYTQIATTPNKLVGDPRATNTVQFFDTTGVPGTTYDYHVKAHSLTANSAYSNTVATTLPVVTATDFAQLGVINTGELDISGTNGDDVLTLTVSGVTLTADLNGNTTTFTNSQVRKVLINMLTGDDSVTIDPHVNRTYIQGGDGNDTILGGGHADSIDGGAGNDYLKGRDGDDTIVGGTGNDTIYGQAGEDSLVGGAGNDRIYGGDKPDSINGGPGNDTLYGEGGLDTLDGGGGKDTILAFE